MDVVALSRLATSIDVEAPLLAKDLGIAPFEARQKLVASLPAVVLFASDRARTTTLVTSLRARGHGVVACDSAAVYAASAMLPARRFRFERDAWVVSANDGDAGTAIPYAEMLAILRATHRHGSVVHEETKERRFRPVAALVTGGLVLTKTVKQDVVRAVEERDDVLYVFRRGHRPCLLNASATHYDGLGDAVRPTRLENFATTLRLFREHAGRVPLDERLVAVKKFPAFPAEARTQRTPETHGAFDSETGGVDLLAHLLAMSLGSQASG